MKTSSLLAIALAISSTTTISAKESPLPVSMGCGEMTFHTVPGWGLGADGKSVLGPTHGGVVVDKAGNVYTSAQKGVVVFSPGGQVVRSFLGKSYSNIHDLEIRDENGTEYIYGARNNDREGLKIKASDGEIVLKLGFPEDSGLDGRNFKPTAITVAPNGDIVLADGYASDRIFKFDKTGKFVMYFGKKGNGLKEFNTAHGMTLDTRYDPPRLLICDRNHQPKGRLVHYGLDGEFIGEVVTGLGMPTSAAVRGDFVSVPDLHGRLVILDKTNTIIAVLGHNPDRRKGGSFGIKQEDWVEGYFSGTHGSYWDGAGNLYVQDWNVSGRIMKLLRMKPGADVAGRPPRLQFEKNGFSIAPLEAGVSAAPYRSAVLYLPATSGYAPHVEVQIEPYVGSIDGYVTITKQKLELVNMTIIAESVGHAAGTATLDYSGKLNGRDLRFYARIELADGRVYVATAAALEAQWSDVGKKLTESVDSMKLE